MCVCEALLVLLHDFCATNHLSRAGAQLQGSAQLLRTTSLSARNAMYSISFLPSLFFPRGLWCLTGLPPFPLSKGGDGGFVERVLFVSFSVRTPCGLRIVAFAAFLLGYFRTLRTSSQRQRRKAKRKYIYIYMMPLCSTSHAAPPLYDARCQPVLYGGAALVWPQWECALPQRCR